MLAAYQPGNSTIRLAEVTRPVPGAGQVLLAMKAPTICGSDLRAISREHLGDGPEAYRAWSVVMSRLARWSRSGPACTGPVGLAVGLLARTMGASLVVGTDPSPEAYRLADSRVSGKVGIVLA